MSFSGRKAAAVFSRGSAWMPVVRHTKFALRYVAYSQFNGAGNIYDGLRRNVNDIHRGG
jgi:hypothetical protein